MSDGLENPAPNTAEPATPGKKNNATGSVGSVSMLTIYACAAIGGMIAAIADLVQKEQASAVLKMTTVSARHLNLAVPPLYIFLIVVGLGVLLCFVFQPNNRKAGFAVGAGVIASIMTVTPYQPLPTGQPSDANGETYLLPGQPGLQLASSSFGPVYLVGGLTDMASIPVTNDLAIPVEVRVSFHDRNSQRTFQQVQAIAPGATRSFEFAARSENGEIDAELYLVVAGEQSDLVKASGAAPYYSDTLLLTQVVPAFAQSQINSGALESYSQTRGVAPGPASDKEVRTIYNKPTGFFNQLQQKLLTPQRF